MKPRKKTQPCLSKADRADLDRKLKAIARRAKDREIEGLRKKIRIQGEWLGELLKIRSMIGDTPELSQLLSMERVEILELIDDLLEVCFPDQISITVSDSVSEASKLDS
jgi:hypothetical protein